MVKVTASEAFEILNKNDKENILTGFGDYNLDRIQVHFLSNVADMVDVNDKSIKEAYKNAVKDVILNL